MHISQPKLGRAGAVVMDAARFKNSNRTFHSTISPQEPEEASWFFKVIEELYHVAHLAISPRM